MTARRVEFKLREAMAAKGIPSMYALAGKSGLAYNTVRPIYHNTVKRADMGTLAALATALDCAPGDLIGWAGSSRKRA